MVYNNSATASSIKCQKSNISKKKKNLKQARRMAAQKLVKIQIFFNLSPNQFLHMQRIYNGQLEMSWVQIAHVV